MERLFRSKDGFSSRFSFVVDVAVPDLGSQYHPHLQLSPRDLKMNYHEEPYDRWWSHTVSKQTLG